VLTAQARVQSAELDLGYCDVRAPVSGLIGAKQVSMGELVGKGQPTLLATISTLNPIWFYCAISEVQYLRAESESRKTGKQVSEMPVTLVLADGTVHPGKGKFVFIDRAVDSKTGTLRVRAEFANQEKLLRPGMFGRIKVDLGTRADSILVPERAVSELQGKTFVWVVDKENKASQRPVKVGESFDDQVMILEGLKPGERIVVEGVQKVREGAMIQVAAAAPMTQVAASESAAPKHAKE
jgi:membrane fusion protein (multidrug efflux system)